jgi:hypothetical protein
MVKTFVFYDMYAAHRRTTYINKLSNAFNFIVSDKTPIHFWQVRQAGIMHAGADFATAIDRDSLQTISMQDLD